MRDRLIDLLQSVPTDYEGNVGIGAIADHLLAEGVIVLPCKVGDTVYWYNMGGKLSEAKVTMIGFAARLDNGFEYDVPFDELGKTVFLSRDEAEYALACEQLKEYKPDAKSIVIGRFVGGNEDAE